MNLKEICQKEKEGLIEHYFYRNISARFTELLIKTNVTANQITMFSLFLGFIASILFLLGEYKFLITGVILYNLAYIFDLVDGELVRYRNYASKLNKENYTDLGQWLDETGDILKVVFVFVGLTLGIYRNTNEHIFLILGLFSISNLFIIYTFMIRRRVKIPEHREFKFNPKFYIGTGEAITALISICVIFNQIYYLLLLFAVGGVLVWLKQFYSNYNLFKKRVQNE